jgi:hypothetical protein
MGGTASAVAFGGVGSEASLAVFGIEVVSVVGVALSIAFGVILSAAHLAVVGALAIVE